MDWNSDLIGLMREFGGTRLARHAHLPLQSGSDAVLRRMHRRYRPWHYTEKVHALREAAGPDLTVGADVMVGFPGETDAEFNETVQLIRQLPFGYLHLFPFSPRPGTRGWELHKQTPVPAAVVEERLAQLRRLAFEKSLAHRSSFVGWQVECITLHTAEPAARQGRSAALTENFLPIEIKEAGLAANQAMVALVTDVTSDGRMLAVRHK
jgi:threonylcarbamoyladenosine tRNA methylthiotransferase MtaB